MITQRLTLPDPLAQAYLHEAEDRNISFEEVLEQRLVCALPLDPRVRPLVVSGMAREQIEDAMGCPPLQNELDLIQQTSRLAKVEFGTHTLKLTPGQTEEIAYRAKKQGKTVDQMLQMVWAAFGEQFFGLTTK